MSDDHCFQEFRIVIVVLLVDGDLPHEHREVVHFELTRPEVLLNQLLVKPNPHDSKNVEHGDQNIYNNNNHGSSLPAYRPLGVDSDVLLLAHGLQEDLWRTVKSVSIESSL